LFAAAIYFAKQIMKTKMKAGCCLIKLVIQSTWFAGEQRQATQYIFSMATCYHN